MPRITACFVILASLLVILVFAGAAQAKKPVFGIESFAGSLTDEHGEPVARAGAHPYELTATFAFTHTVLKEEYFPELGRLLPTEVTSPGEPQSVAVNLPRGTVLDPLATPRCNESQLEISDCPDESAVGVLLIYVKGYPFRTAAALYNMVPPTGVPGQFAANFAGLGITVHIDGRVRSEGDYGLSGEASSIELQYPVYSIAATFWGDPSAASHNTERGKCFEQPAVVECPVPAGEAAFLTMPSACAGQPLLFSLRVDSWKEPAVYDTALSQSPAVSGCAALSAFEPEIKATPENAEGAAPPAPVKSADSPTGLKVDLHVPQQDKLSGPAAPDLKNAVVTLPAGISFNPSSADGLEGCTPAQIGLKAPAQERQAILLPAGAETLTLGFGGQSTPALAAAASAAEVQEALEALPGIGQGNVAVTADSGSWEVTFQGALAGREVGWLSAEVLTPAAQPLAVSTTQAGGAVLFSEKVENPNTESFEYTACPHASKVGNVEVKTPLLEKPLPGSVYLARPFENVPAFGDAAHPGGSLLALYLVVEDPERGVVVKLAGHVEVGGEEGAGAGLAPGQIRTTFDENPQLPVEDVGFQSELPQTDHEGLFGGARAPLTTPPTCGSYETSGELTPWSAPESGPPAIPSSPFEITEGPGGSACAHTPGEEPNKPSFEAGTLAPVAGSYSPLVVYLKREDGSQNFSRVSVTLPPGATGKLAGIPECSNAQIAQAEARHNPGEGALEAASPSCPESSEIGTVTVGAGSGAPFYVTGKAYLAGPYQGAPFSGVFIAPALAGPFDLGTVVVRAGIYINPETAQVTTRSDPLPTELDGIPLDIRSLEVNVNRNDFTLNPTSCTPMTATGEETSTQSQSAALSDRFQVGGCQTLPFAPKLTASVGAHASKANGTTFDVRLESAGIGQANIHKVDLQLPAALPSRLTTLQKACLEAVFASNPSSCSPESIIGKATIHTPLLNNPLTGPAYLVSHGGAEFPDVEFVLQGEGVTLILDGKTDIKKEPNGTEVTYSKFETAPDAPFTTFETELPAGPKSILGAYANANEPYNLCKANLAMPTEITGQNGAVIRQTTQITAAGCPPSLTITKAKLNGNTVQVTVKLVQAGNVKISGKGLRTTTKRKLNAGTHTVTVPLTATGRAAKRHKSKLKVRASETIAGQTGTANTAVRA